MTRVLVARLIPTPIRMLFVAIRPVMIGRTPAGLNWDYPQVMV
jgi:hypothetical protein